MRLAASRFAWLLPLVLCACAHNPTQSKMQMLAPPPEETPPPPDLAPNALPPPVYSIPKTNPPVALPPEPAKVEPKHHRPSTKTANAEKPSTPPAQVAEAAAPPEESALGVFQTPEAPDSKKQTENTIGEIERGLNGLGRKLSDQETKTSMQIREFLKQARTALGNGDVDAAKTLAIKAKALLGELSQ